MKKIIYFIFLTGIILFTSSCLPDTIIPYTPTPVFQEELGYATIIFNKLDEYEPINPEDWFNFGEEKNSEKDDVSEEVVD